MNSYFLRHHALVPIVFLALCLLPLHAAGEEKIFKDTRPPAVAGMFYPGSAPQLRRTVTAMLDQVPEVNPAGPVLAALAPHAGYIYSGQVAAYTHKMLAQVDFDTLIIIGHDTYQDAIAFTCPVDYFETPLGKVPVDREMISRMQAFNKRIKPHRSLHAREHTVEVHLPFLQAMGRKCKIIPLLFGNPTAENCRALSDTILATAGGKKVFVLASTDMSHYPPYESAREIDTKTLEALGSLDISDIFGYLKDQEGQNSVPNLRTAMCARGGVGTAILCAKARGANHVQVLRYANSGDVPGGDKRRVVGYCSVLIVKTTGHNSR